MTKDEAITVLKSTTVNLGRANGKTLYVEAMNMAISALQAQEGKHSTESSSTHKALDTISRQAAIDEITEYGSGDTIYMSVAEFKRRIEHLPSIQPDNSCDGCKYENADDGVLVPCGFCKRSHPDNYERRSDGQTD